MVMGGSEEVTFEQFAVREFDQVVALALASLRDEQDALDVAQETMTRTFRCWAEVSGLDRPGAWSRRVALNLITDRFRERARRGRLVDRLRSRASRSANVEVAVWDEDLWSEVAALPRRRREVIVLHYVLDVSVEEIAEIVSAPVGTVKSDLARARERLRSQLEGGDERLR